MKTDEIAQAFLTPAPTLAQRLVRAKAKIREARIPYQVPAAADLPDRLTAVLRVVYLVFNEGYSASSGESVTRHNLSAEAIRLVRRRAAEWGVDPKRVGFVGFSAGGITAANVSTLDPTGRPDFVGIIYGALHNPVPADAPPAFIATSAAAGT